VCDRDGTRLIQREDDKETAVARRLTEYEERTAPLIDYYRERARFSAIDGDRAVDAVFRDVQQAVEGEA
jgi:adenylate kinase